jgi:hypothetical protein
MWFRLSRERLPSGYAASHFFELVISNFVFVLASLDFFGRDSKPPSTLSDFIRKTIS